MTRVKCDWDTCRFCKDGECTKEEIELVDVVPKGRGSLLDCKNFEWADDESEG